jgi:hypothetical protein
MIQLILYFIQLIFSSLCLFVNKSSKNVAFSPSSEETSVSSPKNKGNTGGKKKKPKRNRSAFIIFSSTKRAELKSLHDPELNSNEMMVKLAELWRDLPEYQKRMYHDEAEKEKLRYLHDLNEFYENNPNEVIQNKTKKNHVKKPCSAYALYLKDTKKIIKNESPDLKMADILKVVAQRWRELNETQRSVYQQKALAEKEVTKAKMNEYLSCKVEEPVLPKKSSPQQKKEQSRKKPSKASDFQLEENSFSNFRLEEPMIQKKRILSVNVQPTSMPQNVSYFNQEVNFNMYDNGNLDYYLNEIQSLARNYSVKAEQPNNDLTITKDMSMIWKNSMEPIQMSHFFSDTLDLMDFKPMKMESVKFVGSTIQAVKEEEEDSSDTTHMSPSQRMNANDMVMGLLDSDASSYDAFGEDLWSDFLKQNQNERSEVDLF